MVKKLQKIQLIRRFKLDGIKKGALFGFSIGIWIALNVVIQPFGVRLDLSKGKAYTLSQSTAAIARKLDDIVTIKFYISENMPTRLIPLKNSVIDLLNEYKKEGGNKIVFKVVDPSKDEKIASEVKELGIPELPFQELQKDKYAVSNTYFGISIAYLDKKEIIPQATDINNLEYNVTSLVYKLTRKDQPKIGVMGFDISQSPGSQDPIAAIKKVLGQQFVIEDIILSTDSGKLEIPSEVKTLMIFDTGTKTYDGMELSAISSYLDKGGKALLFLDGTWVSESLGTEPAKHALDKIISTYGITLNNNLLLSNAAELVNFGSNEMQFFAPYPFWLKTNVFDTKFSYFSNINQVTFPWVSSITLAKKTGYNVTELVKTVPQSWEQKDAFTLDPQQIPQPNQKDLKEFIIAAESKNTKGGMIVVFGSSRFVQDRFIGGQSDNIEVVINVMNNIASGGALSGIRSRAVSFYPLPALSESEKDIYTYVMILLLPILFAVYGGIRLLRRR